MHQIQKQLPLPVASAVFSSCPAFRVFQRGQSYWDRNWSSSRQNLPQSSGQIFKKTVFLYPKVFQNSRPDD